MVEAIFTSSQQVEDPTLNVGVKADEENKISKSQLDRSTKKLKNRTKQAITVLCKAEDLPYEQLFSQEPTTNMFVAHFGNGDEADQELVLSYVKEKAGNDAFKEITILPGTNYGHFVLKSAN